MSVHHNESILASDLGQVAKAIGDRPYDKTCASSLAQVVARLHGRGKGNEQHARGLRMPIEEDAEMAIQSLGFAIRDTGWARA